MAALVFLGGAETAAAGVVAARLARRARDHGRLCGRSLGIRFRRPRRRVPGFPRDDVLLTGEEKAVFAEIEAAVRRRRRHG